MTETFTNFNLRPTWMALTSIQCIRATRPPPTITDSCIHQNLCRMLALKIRGNFEGMSELLCDRAKATYRIPRPSELSPTHDRIQDPHRGIQSFRTKVQGGGGGGKENN